MTFPSLLATDIEKNHPASAVEHIEEPILSKLKTDPGRGQERLTSLISVSQPLYAASLFVGADTLQLQIQIHSSVHDTILNQAVYCWKQIIFRRQDGSTTMYLGFLVIGDCCDCLPIFSAKKGLHFVIIFSIQTDLLIT